MAHSIDGFFDNFGGKYVAEVLRRPLDELVAFLLGHAAGDAKNQLRILALDVLDFTDFAIDLVLRRFAHGAGIDDEKVSLFHRRIIGEALIADIGQLPCHAFGIGHVHLTAINQKFDIALGFAIYYLHTSMFIPFAKYNSIYYCSKSRSICPWRI